MSSLYLLRKVCFAQSIKANETTNSIQQFFNICVDLGNKRADLAEKRAIQMG